jgi:hypothetical protein
MRPFGDRHVAPASTGQHRARRDTENHNQLMTRPATTAWIGDRTKRGQQIIRNINRDATHAWWPCALTDVDERR